MNLDQTIAKLYYLLTTADGIIDERELKIGEKMILLEKLNRESFLNEFELLKEQDREMIYKDCLNGLHQLTRNSKIKFIAWMGIVASSDGILDDKEWEIIYKLYNKEFNLDYKDVNTKRKEIWSQVSTTHA